MSKLVLYSDQIVDVSEKVDEALLRLIGKGSPMVAYIPSCSDKKRVYFNQKVDYYARLGIRNLYYFDLDEEYDEDQISTLLSCDVIHLSGGNTYRFLNNLKNRNFLVLLRKYVHDGGILVGVSAGAILMSHTIKAARICDTNEGAINDLLGIGMVDFDFFPHYKGNHDYLDAVLQFSRDEHSICYLCHDSDGIIINNGVINSIGSPFKVINGVIQNI